MRINRQLWLTVSACGLVVLGSGCGGVNTSHSVSPASFFVPGLMRVAPPPALDQAPLTAEAAEQLAQAR